MTENKPTEPATPQTAERYELGVAPAEARLPAVIPAPVGQRRRRRWPRLAALLLVLSVVAGGGTYWWLRSGPAVPASIVFGNGRLEADEIDIDTKFAGRIARVLVDEGDLVSAGQVVAVMDTRDLEASFKQYQALIAEARQTLDQAKANFAQQQAVVIFARQQVARSAYLVPKGFATQQTLDQQKQQLDSATATLAADAAAIGAAQRALDAATHQAELYQVNIEDNTLVAPRGGPIEYRVANVGEVLPAGGKVFTMLDASYVYMDIYLPTAQAGRIRYGADARIVLDAYPAHPIPAKVVYIASQAQFTPKTVETEDERAKLMFRIRVRIDPARLQGRANIVRSGLPGVAYVRTDPHVAWPPQLRGEIGS